MRLLACFCRFYYFVFYVIEIAWRLDPRTGRLIVMSAEDNLVKGASGQAVQCLNIMCDFPETAGLV